MDDLREDKARREQREDEELDDTALPERLLPHEMLASLEGINVLAPLVRCSKLPFRHLVSRYNTHITHTPMTLAAEFSRNATAREADFSTSSEERGVFWLEEKRGSSRKRRKIRGSLIAQFAASEAKSFADACELIYPFVDGIDLNAGCPQKWAYQEKIGSYLLRQPETVRDLIRSAKDRLGWDYPVSLKIRVDDDPKQTEALVNTAIQSGISHLTIHGRTRLQPSTHPVDLDAIAFATSLVGGRVPCVANGDVWTPEDVELTRQKTGCSGVMAARGLLANPALFAGYSLTPVSAVHTFINVSHGYGFPYALFQRHLAMMLETRLSRPERIWFNSLGSSAGCLDWLEDRGWGGWDNPLGPGGAGEEVKVVKGWDGK